MKKSVFVLLLLAVISTTTVFPLENAINEDSEYTHAQVAAEGFIPYFGSMLISSSMLFLPQDLMMHFMSLESTLLNIPAAIVNPTYTLTGTAITTSSWATGIFLSNYPQLYGNPCLTSLFANAGFKGNMWLQYKGYEKARSMVQDGIYRDYEPLSFTDAFTAPFSPNVLSKKAVWIPILVYTAGIIGLDCLGGFDNSVFKTGESYIGNYKFPIALGTAAVFALSCINFTFTAVGEEALFRGTGYEEMKVSFGIIPAKIVDAVAFPAVHIPQQVIAGIDWSSILFTTLLQSGTSFLLQWVYDQGGLRDSIAVHAWIDIISYVCSYLFTSGTEGNNFSLNINFSFKL